MRQTLKQFVRLMAGYSPVTLLAPLFTILLTPLYTRVLDPADYGVVDVATTLFALISTFVMLGIDQALNAHFFDGDSQRQSNLVTTAILYVATAGIVVGVIVSLAAVPLAQLLFKDPARSLIIYLLSFSMISSSVYAIINTALRLRMNVKYVNTLGLTYLFMTIASNVLFVIVLGFKATGIIATITLTNFVTCVVGLLLIYRTLRGRFSRNLLTPLLRTGLGLLPATISTLLLMSADRLLLTQYVSQNDIGLYSIANKLGTMMYVLVSAAWSAWWPIALQMADSPDAPRQYARMFEYLLVGTMVLALGIGLFAPEILSVVTREAYVPAAPYALVLLIYFGPISSVISSFQIGLYARKQVKWISIFVFISAVINIILNLWLNPVIGVWGAVWATVIAGATLAVLLYFVSQRVYPVPYPLVRVAGLGAFYLAIIGIALNVPSFNNVFFKAGSILLFMLFALLIGVVTTDQIRMGLQSVRYRLSHLTHGKPSA
jgi:O-antigen/teichoic acid export membrane protein